MPPTASRLRRAGLAAVALCLVSALPWASGAAPPTPSQTLSLTAWQQISMMLTLMLASKGVAGVPRGALVVLTAMLTAFGLPLEGAALLLGVDQIMDMGRTGVNVLGNCLAAVVVARWEGVFDDELFGAVPGAGGA